MDLTNADFDAFRISKTYVSYVSSDASLAASGQNPSFAKAFIEERKEAVRRDPKPFPELKDDRKSTVFKKRASDAAANMPWPSENLQPAPFVPSSVTAPGRTVMTRQQKEEAYKHVVNVVLDILDTEPTAKALTKNGYRRIDQLVGITEKTISSLTYVTNANKTNNLNLAEQETLNAFRIWMKSKTDRNVALPRTFVEWMDLTNADFDAFRISKTYVNYVSGDAPLTASGQNPSFAKALIEERKEAVRRDPKPFPELKDDRKWNRFKSDTIIQAKAQNLEDVLKSKAEYTPDDPIDAELFQLDNNFMFGVLHAKVHTTQGKAILREHENTMDAQAVWSEMCTAYDTGTAESVKAADIMKYVMTTRITDGGWTGTKKNYILHWEDQIRQFNDLTDPAMHLHESWKQVMLELAVSDLPDFARVRDIADLIQTATKNNTAGAFHLDYTSYRSLLLSTAERIDAEETESGGKIRHKVYAHETADLDASIDDIRDNIALCEDAERLEAYESRRISNRPVLPFATWKSLPKKAQDVWDQLDDDDKRKILDSRPSTPSTRSVQTHEFTLPVIAEQLTHQQDTISVLTHSTTGREKDSDRIPTTEEDDQDDRSSSDALILSIIRKEMSRSRTD
jgi:hypothetical protein